MEKVFVSKNGSATIKCPGCNDVKSVNVSKFMGKQHVLKAKCPCGNVFSVRLDFRKTFRKDVMLQGNIRLADGKSGWIGVTLKNISKGGVGLMAPGIRGIMDGDIYEVKFFLDDNHKTLIQRKVVIRLVEGSYIGCQFTGPAMHDQEKALGFYLMP